MNTEEILLQILEEQKKTRADINDIRTDINGIHSEINEMRSDINGIHSEINEMRSDMTEMRSDITELQNNQREMLDKQNKFEAKQDTLEKDIKSIKITLENEVSPAIRTLTELQVQNSVRLVDIERDVRDLKDNTAINEVLFGLERMKTNR